MDFTRREIIWFFLWNRTRICKNVNRLIRVDFIGFYVCFVMTKIYFKFNGRLVNVVFIACNVGFSIVVKVFYYGYLILCWADLIFCLKENPYCHPVQSICAFSSLCYLWSRLIRLHLWLGQDSVAVTSTWIFDVLGLSTFRTDLSNLSVQELENLLAENRMKALFSIFVFSKI